MDDETRDRVLASVKEWGGSIRVKNALNPILWLCGIVAVPCIYALAFSPNPHPAIVWVLGGVVSTALLGFLFLLIFDRDRLQSEDYLLRNKTLELIEEKGSKRAIDAATVQAISQNEF